MARTEPINLREWTAPGNASRRGRLFTCGRPGRATFGTARVAVSERIIDLWANGLPKADILHIVSLLGRKRDDFSEFGYYPFRSEAESGTKPTFQDWLKNRYGERFVVHEFPTTDTRSIPHEILQAAARCILGLVRDGNAVVIIDSAGAKRTPRVCRAIGYRPNV